MASRHERDAALMPGDGVKDRLSGAAYQPLAMRKLFRDFGTST